MDSRNETFPRIGSAPGKTAAVRAAASATAIAAVCGAFYIGTLFSGGRDTSMPSGPKPVATTASETTGSAPAQETPDVASAEAAATGAADCQEQTWPYIARPCLANEKSKRGVRVISTDKLADPVISMVQAPPDAVTNRRAAAPEPAQAQTAAASSRAAPAYDSAPLTSGAALGAIAFSAAAKPEPVETAPAATPEPASPAETATASGPAATPAQPEPAVQAAPAPSDPPASSEKKASRAAALEKSKRKAKRQETERIRTVTVQSDDDDDEPVVETRNGRFRSRMVERGAERDITVPSYEGNGTRRIIVIDRDGNPAERGAYASDRGTGGRGGFPNIFGAIFGGGD